MPWSVNIFSYIYIFRNLLDCFHRNLIQALCSTMGFVSSFLQDVCASIGASDDWSYEGGFCVHVSDQNQSWNNAVTECRSKRGRLPTAEEVMLKILVFHFNKSESS